MINHNMEDLTYEQKWEILSQKILESVKQSLTDSNLKSMFKWDLEDGYEDIHGRKLDIASVEIKYTEEYIYNIIVKNVVKTGIFDY